MPRAVPRAVFSSSSTRLFSSSPTRTAPHHAQAGQAVVRWFEAACQATTPTKLNGAGTQVVPPGLPRP